MRRFCIGIGVSLAAAFAAGSATAGSSGLAGTYEGKGVCAGIVSGTPSKDPESFAGASAVLISDIAPGRVALRLPGRPDFHLFVEPIVGIPVTGLSSLGGINCPLEIGALQGSTFLGTSKQKGDGVKMKAVMILLDDAGGQAQTCKLSLKRVDAADPGGLGCN